MAFIVVDNTHIYYAMPRGRGNGKDQVLAFFIHGGGGSSRHWEPLLPHLPQQFCPLLIDLPGHGRSEGVASCSVEHTADFLDRFLKQLVGQQPVWCIGHSMGGIIAQCFALRFPSSVKALVLIATATSIRFHTDFVQSAATGHWDLEVFRPIFHSSVSLDLQNLVLAEYPKLRIDATADISMLGATTFREELSTLTLPTLIITGDDDVVVSPRHSRTLSHILAHATLVILPGGGHYVQVEQPQQMARELERFLHGQVRHFETQGQP